MSPSVQFGELVEEGGGIPATGGSDGGGVGGAPGDGGGWVGWGETAGRLSAVLVRIERDRRESALVRESVQTVGHEGSVACLTFG